MAPHHESYESATTREQRTDCALIATATMPTRRIIHLVASAEEGNFTVATSGLCVCLCVCVHNISEKLRTDVDEILEGRCVAKGTVD